MPDDITTRPANETSPDAEAETEVEQLRAELERMREALASTERQLFALREQRSATIARLERQAYWLERGRVDLDAWMRKRPLFVAFRLFSALLRVWNRLARSWR
jgi:hypothetical protein